MRQDRTKNNNGGRKSKEENVSLLRQGKYTLKGNIGGNEVKECVEETVEWGENKGEN